MKITYFGHSCFLLQTNGGVTIVTDPYKGVGYELPTKIKATLALISHAHFDHNNIEAVDCEFVFDKVGTYELYGVKVQGIDSEHDEKGGALRGKNVIFTVEADGVRVCHFGDLGEPCNEKLVEKIGRVDVLLIPVGGKYTINSLEAKAYIEQIQPKIVIPMHYKGKDGTIDIATAVEFLSLFNNVEYANPKHQIDTNDLLLTTEAPKIIYMERE